MLSIGIIACRVPPPRQVPRTAGIEVSFEEKPLAMIQAEIALEEG
jgi:hypothetical protein